MEDLYEQMVAATVAGDATRCEALAHQALEAGVAPIDAIQQGFARGMHLIGDRFARLDCFLPEVILAAEAMEAAVGVLKPRMLGQPEQATAGTVVLGTMQGDLHDLGKNIVKIMLQADGFEVHDLGSDVSVRQFVDHAEDVGADIIAGSAILTTTMAHMPDLARMLDELGLRSKYALLLGGAPVIRRWALEEAGADGYGEDATDAVTAARELMARRQGGNRR
jgi:trimethylamine corrinoid protein